MVLLCAVVSCPNRKNPTAKVFKFPSFNQANKFERWKEFAVRASSGVQSVTKFEHYGLCAEHFFDEDFRDAERCKLKKDAIPSLVNGAPLKIENGTGSDEEDSEFHLRSTVFKLERSLADEVKSRYELESRIMSLEKDVIKGKQHKKQLDSVLNRFPPGTRRMLLDPSKQSVFWKEEDISKALPLYSISPKAYEYVRDNILPIPSPSFLRSHLAKNKSSDATHSGGV